MFDRSNKLVGEYIKFHRLDNTLIRRSRTLRHLPINNVPDVFVELYDEQIFGFDTLLWLFTLHMVAESPLQQISIIDDDDLGIGDQQHNAQSPSSFKLLLLLIK
ncbi:hypothetical protein DERP_010421 [Dermatophagoides pteronyssinus]|uniref:Uncharacterized protein n=1 Tax=Dermatophagoides pteronyssinus TaxID=6956 RepID=A0ABQ8J4U8_DERPT|nr:hypothetical protein DERP_010421 [Dermatophagoides pteronyssinus]